jgi:hypothetical protein
MRTTYSVAPETADHCRDTTLPWMLATVRFVGTHEVCAGGGDDGEEALGDDDEGPVGDELALSAPPHAPVTAAASTIDNTPARFIPALLLRSILVSASAFVGRITDYGGTGPSWA